MRSNPAFASDDSEVVRQRRSALRAPGPYSRPELAEEMEQELKRDSDR
jgi:hypothetical protein